MSDMQDYVIALSTDQTSNHRQVMERLDKIEHRITTMEKNMHERSIYFQGLVMGVREAVLSRLDRIEKALTDGIVVRPDTKPLSMGGSE